MSRSVYKKRQLEFCKAVLGGWTFQRDVTAYAHGEWYAVEPDSRHWHGPYKHRWMAVDEALIELGAKVAIPPPKTRPRPVRMSRSPEMWIEERETKLPRR